MVKFVQVVCVALGAFLMVGKGNAQKPCGAITTVALKNSQVLAGSARGELLLSKAGLLEGRDLCSGPEQWNVAASTLPALTNVSVTGAAFWLLGHQEGIYKYRADEKLYEANLAPKSPQAVLDLIEVRSGDSETAQQLLAVGTRGLFLQSEDSGDSWEAKDLYIDPEWEEPDDYNLYAILQLQSGRFLVAGETGVIYWSNDGADWERETVGGGATWFGAVEVSGGVLLHGFGGALAHKAAGDNDWLLKQSPSGNSLYTAAVLDNGVVILAGAKGELLQWKPPGELQPFQSGTSAAIIDLAVTNTQLLMATDKGLKSVALVELVD